MTNFEKFSIVSKKRSTEHGMYLHKLNMSLGRYDNLGRKYSMWRLQDRKDLIAWLLENDFKMEIISEWQEQGIRKAWFKKGMTKLNIDHESLIAYWSNGWQDFGSAVYQEQLEDFLIESLPYADKVKVKKQRSKEYIGF